MSRNGCLIFAVLILILLLISPSANATPEADIVYNETDLGSGLWQYDYSFYNASSNNEYLYNVYLDFSQQTTVNWLSIPTGWDSTLWGHTPADVTSLDSFSIDPAYDLAAGNSLDSFSFTTGYQAGDVSYTAYFDDHQGGITSSSGVTSSLVPEPVSSVLFLTGGVAIGFRRYFKRRNI